jgi:hypothetical protein
VSAIGAPAKVFVASTAWQFEEPFLSDAIFPCCEVRSNNERSDGELRCISPDSSQDAFPALGADSISKSGKFVDAATASTCTSDAASDSGPEHLVDSV